MKKALVGIVIGVALSLGLYYFLPAPLPEKPSVDPSLKVSTRVEIKDMTCFGCEGKLKKGLLNIDPVLAVETDPEESEVKVTYIRGQFSKKQVLDTIRDMGFDASLAKGESKLEVLKFNISIQ